MNALDDNVTLTYEDLVRDPELAERAIQRGRRMHAQAVSRLVSTTAKRLFGADDAGVRPPAAPATASLATPNNVRTAACG